MVPADYATGYREAVEHIREFVATDADCVERARARAVEAGLDATAVDGFAGMDRETLILQAALWHRLSNAHQNRSLDVELGFGKVIGDLFDLCREHGVEVPDAIVDAATAVRS